MRTLLVVIAVSAAASLWGGVANAQNLGWRPLRVIIEDRDRTASLTLTNRGKRTASFRIELIDIQYHDNGTVTQLSKDKMPAGFPTARPYIRFSPRQVRLEAGQSQKVRVKVRGKKLPAGEYRVHALLRELPQPGKLDTSRVRENTAGGRAGVSQAVALPVIIRRGKTSAVGRIKVARLTGNFIDVHLTRTGNRSLYTDMIVRDKDNLPVTSVRGVALPVPNTMRMYRLKVPAFALNQKRVGGFTIELIDKATGKRLHKQPVTK